MSNIQLIVDSGGTKASWAFTNLPFEEIVETKGLHPLLLSREQMLEIIRSVEWPVPFGAVKEIFFYGAGCGQQVNVQKVRNVLRYCFPQATVVVESDLLAAARALYGREKGLMGILGTGAHAAYYNGEGIDEKATSLGWLLSDEGSGALLGKELLQKILRKKMSSEILHDFREYAQSTDAEIIQALYATSSANRYCAQFVPFLAQHVHKPEIMALVKGQFEIYYQEYLKPLVIKTPCELRMVGGVAWHFQHILKEVLKNEGLNLELVEKTPIRSLLKYHQKKTEL
ncbi:hypothetical protein [Persicobacter sp. CCB-QB2]|uniref:hypothetical protein n=1 Tax=Persicobacter sp. CCB-QB2 TaxID=1561025 RepID=UPI000AD418BC|nr:hypothetical protein [Persicobacter sp. CCB-QB2]